MCGRASLTKNQKELEERFGIEFYSEDIERYNPIPNYNLAPLQYFPIIKNTEKDYFSIARWGLIPYWAKNEKLAHKLINARAETLSEKRSFSGSLERRRCIVPIDGYYEWKKVNNIKKPYRIVRNDKRILSVAGLWDKWEGVNGEKIETFTMITVNANSILKKLHHRMPAFLFEDEEDLWIDESNNTKDVIELLKPFPSDLLYAYPVSSQVNNVKNNNKDLILEIPETNISQGSLF